MPTERRLAAIMFTDIVGYTALMAESEERGHRVRERQGQVLRPLVEQYGGEWISHVGDETLSSFPSAVDAVNCALAIQAALREEAELSVRIGIHIGDVVVREGSLHGDGVNIAARVRPLAEAGGICISDEVQHAVQNQAHLGFAALGAQQFKNVPRPVPVYRVTGAAPPPRRLALIRRLGVRRPRRWLGAAAVLLALIGFGVWSRYRPVELTPIRSLAVLPLENLSGDPEQDYFADGMTEALIAELGQLRGLRVTSRTSVMRYKDGRGSLREIAKELGVDGIVEGSVLRAGDRVRITAQLIHAPTDSHLWSHQYERELRDVLHLQRDVARAISEQVQTETRLSDRSDPRRVHPGAYEATLKGFHLRSAGDIRLAMRYFEQAIALDPEYAPPRAALGGIYATVGALGMIPPQAAIAQQRSEIFRALELDSELAAAYGELGGLHTWEWDWSSAEQAYRHGLELNPSHASLRMDYGYFLAHMGRFDEALTEFERARLLDPLSLEGLGFGASAVLMTLGRVDEAVEMGREMVRIYPNHGVAHGSLGLAYSVQGNHQRAVAEMRKATELLQGVDFVTTQLAYVLARAGQRPEAVEILDELIQQAGKRYVAPGYIAQIYAGLGDSDSAFEWLEKAYEERDWRIVLLKEWPTFAPLRADPRYDDLLRRAGFPETPDAL